MAPSTLLRNGNFSATGRVGRAAPASVNLGPPHISESITAKKLKFYTHSGSQPHFSEMKIFPPGKVWGQQ